MRQWRVESEEQGRRMEDRKRKVDGMTNVE